MKKTYCIFCGTENDIKNKKCTNCKKKLNQKNTIFIDYVKGKFKEKIEGDIIDEVYNKSKSLIFKYLYGLTLTVSLSFAVVTVAKNILENKTIEKNIKEVYNKPVYVCNLEETKEKELICETGYELIDDKCVKENTEDSIITQTCPEGYTLNDNKCISNSSTPLIETNSCNINDVPDNFSHTSTISTGVYFTFNKKHIFKLIDSSDKCYIYLCSMPEHIISYPGNTEKYCEADKYGGYEVGENIPKFVKTSCPSGYTLINNACKIVINPTNNYSCSEGILNENKCIIKQELEPELECPDNYQYNDKCKVCVKNEN